MGREGRGPPALRAPPLPVPGARPYKPRQGLAFLVLLVHVSVWTRLAHYSVWLMTRLKCTRWGKQMRVNAELVQFYILFFYFFLILFFCDLSSVSKILICLSKIALKLVKGGGNKKV